MVEILEYVGYSARCGPIRVINLYDKFMRHSHPAVVNLAQSAEQDGVSMIVEKSPLTVGEGAHIDRLLSLNTHAAQGLLMRDRGNYRPASILEADKAAIEQMIDRRGQQQPVLPIQSFLVV